MIKYKEIITAFREMLEKEDWPTTVFIPPQDYWAVIIASEGKMKADWHFEDGIEGYPFFILGPTIVRPCKRNELPMVLEDFQHRRKGD